MTSHGEGTKKIEHAKFWKKGTEKRRKYGIEGTKKDGRWDVDFYDQTVWIGFQYFVVIVEIV